MGTMVLQVSSFKCILQRQLCYSASAITAATTTTKAAPPTATTTAAATRAREGPLSITPDSLFSLANVLVNSLEFSQQQALSISTKLTKSRRCRAVKFCYPYFYTNAELVISFLQEKGLEKPQIKKLISSLPVVLTCEIETNLEPKMSYFLGLGASVSDFVDLILSHPVILRYALDSTIHSAVEALREIMGSNENVVTILKASNSRRNAFPAINGNLIRNVSFLRAQGCPVEYIRKCVLQNGPSFVRKHESFKDMAARAEVEWGVSPRSALYPVAVHVLCCLNERTMESKCQVFESFGWDRSHVVCLFRCNPRCLGLGKRNIEAKLNFFMNELGYGPGLIAKHRSLLCFSLEKRVMPRHLVFQLLKEKGLIRKKISFPNALSLPEDKFLRKFILPFLNDVPNLYDIYVNSRLAATKEETALVSQE